MRPLIFSCFQHLSKSKSYGSASLMSAGAKKPLVSNTHHGGLASRFAQLAMASDEDEGCDSSSSDEEDEAEEEQPTVEEPKSRFLQTTCCGKTRLLFEPAFEDLKSWRGTLDCHAKGAPTDLGHVLCRELAGCSCGEPSDAERSLYWTEFLMTSYSSPQKYLMMN